MCKILSVFLIVISPIIRECGLCCSGDDPVSYIRKYGHCNVQEVILSVLSIVMMILFAMEERECDFCCSGDVCFVDCVGQEIIIIIIIILGDNNSNNNNNNNDFLYSTLSPRIC